MNKFMRIFTVAVLFSLILALNPFSASAGSVIVRELDTWESTNDGYAGPIYTGKLEAGERYHITVEGTFSVWPKDFWGSYCIGEPEETANGPVGIDAGYIFSAPTISSACKPVNPAKESDIQYTLFQMSPDGGSNWIKLEQTEAYNTEHVYHYEVVATDALNGFGFRFQDAPLDDNYGKLKFTVEMINNPPVVEINGPYNDYEGSEVEFTSVSSDPDGHSLTYKWDFGDGNTSAEEDTTHAYADNGVYDVTFTVTDSFGLSTEVKTTATILNVAPSVGPISVDANRVPINTTINAAADFTDPGTGDTHTAVWDWGDGSSTPGIVDQSPGYGSVKGSHKYTKVGEYLITLTVTDDDKASDTAVYEFLVVHDPKDFITGGGWIWSPENACPVFCGSVTGKVNFGFVSKYIKNLEIPSGQTEFQFQDGNLNFHSKGYEWLTVVDDKAQYQGVGTINGSGEYGFILTAIDGKKNKGAGGDKIRMKIWDKTTGEVIYDTQMGDSDFADPTTVLHGGSIVIHDR